MQIVSFSSSFPACLCWLQLPVGAANSGGAVYTPGGGSPSADSGSGEGAASGDTFTAQDLLDLSNSGSIPRIVDLLTDRDEASSETTTLDLTAASLSLPAGCTIVITLTIDGKAHSYTAREENGSFHFEFPFVASDTEVQAVMDVYDATGMLILTGTAEKTVSGTLDALEVALAPPAESSSDGPFTVSFDTAGGSAIASIEDIAPGSAVELPSPGPTKADCVFLGWYTAPGGSTRFDFSSIMASATAYAKWLPVDDTIAASTTPSGYCLDYFEGSSGGTHVLALQGFQKTASWSSSVTKFVNSSSGTTTTIYMDIHGTNKLIGDNHGGLKFTNTNTWPPSSPDAGHFEVIFTTSSSGTIELGFQTAGTGGCIQVEQVTANFSVAEGCTVSEMKIGSTEYTDWNTFITAARANTSAYTNASFKITRN